MNERENLHRLLGGRNRYDPDRYWNRPEAREVRSHMKVLIRAGYTVGQIADLIGVSSTCLSLAMGGRAGEEKMETIIERLADGVGDRSFSLT